VPEPWVERGEPNYAGVLGLLLVLFYFQLIQEDSESNIDTSTTIGRYVQRLGLAWL
jgi:hypothetical protein